MAKAYYGTRISENMTVTNEGFLICHNVPIARTGVQKYLPSELGIKDDRELVSVYREPEDVFSQKTIASFEGKIFTDDHPNGEGWVNPINYQNFMKGTIRNVRRGTGLENDLLLADIVCYDNNVISKIQGKIGSKKREVSCGYECEYVDYKDGYKQKNIVGNHVSLVDAGRAGSRVAIRDSEENILQNDEGRVKKMGNVGKYNIPKKSNSKASDVLKAIGLKMFAQDSDPEELLDVMDELTEEKIAEREKDEEPIIEAEFEEAKNVDGEAEGGDSRIEALEQKLEKVIDLVQSLLNAEEPETEEEEVDTLDELETELENEAVNDDQMEEEESVTVDPELINGTENAEEMEEVRNNDSALRLLRMFKPVVAAIPDKTERKKAKDALEKEVRKIAKDSKASPYHKMSNVNKNVTQDAATEDKTALGREIAKKFNPHYKEA